MDSSVPYFKPGATVTGRTTAAVEGGRFLKVSGNRIAEMVAVAQAGAGEPAIGVSSRKKASGEAVMFYRDGVANVEAGGTITAGAPIKSDATGRAVAAVIGTDANICGTAWADATVGVGVPVSLTLR